MTQSVIVVGGGIAGLSAAIYAAGEGARVSLFERVTELGGRARTRDEQEACVDAVRFKCNVLWVQLDALQHAYVEGHVPPGAFRPEA